MHWGNGMGMGWNVWWIFGIVIVAGVLWLVLKSFGRRTPPGGSC